MTSTYFLKIFSERPLRLTYRTKSVNDNLCLKCFKEAIEADIQNHKFMEACQYRYKDNLYLSVKNVSERPWRLIYRTTSLSRPDNDNDNIYFSVYKMFQRGHGG
jgi:hypothetical protein